MDFQQATVEQRREQLKNEIMNLELQLAGRERDVRHWTVMRDIDLGEAIRADSRIANNRDEEAKSQLAGAHYDCIKLQAKLTICREAYAALGPAPKADSRA